MEQHLLYGVVNLDKPAGPTSHEVTAWVRDMLELPRAGHSGSLDPGVTGVLPVMLGKATKVVSVLRLSAKEYICMMRLHREMPAPRIREVCAEFTGPIYQTPPVVSAVKRALRVRNIYSLDVLDICGPLVLMRIRCEAGTYIRKLCHDIGLVLGCGAHMQQLRRTGTGPFGEDTLVTLHDLKDAFVLWKEEGREEDLRRVVKPMEEALRHLPSITVRDSAVNAICHGAALAIPGVAGVDENLEQDAIAVMYSLKGEAVALCRSRMSAGEILESEHGICGITERVIMDADIYPTGWKTKSPCSG
jgi:H/ACA ribonucleoprotein complex subunit 4